jgi:hypothetical protein
MKQRKFSSLKLEYQRFVCQLRKMPKEDIIGYIKICEEQIDRNLILAKLAKSVLEEK